MIPLAAITITPYCNIGGLQLLQQHNFSIVVTWPLWLLDIKPRMDIVTKYTLCIINLWDIYKFCKQELISVHCRFGQLLRWSCLHLPKPSKSINRRYNSPRTYITIININISPFAMIIVKRSNFIMWHISHDLWSFTWLISFAQV